MKKIYIYGAGNMGEAVAELLQKKGLRITAFIDRNNTLYGKYINDIPILLPDKIDREDMKYSDFVVSMAARPYREIEIYLRELGGGYNIYCAGDYVQKQYGEIVLTNVWDLKKLSVNEKKILCNYSDIWEDKISKNCYDIALSWFENRNEIIPNCNYIIDREKYFPEFIKNLICNNDIMVDTGVLDETYIDKFKSVAVNGKVFGFQLFHHNNHHIMENFKAYDNVSIISKEAGDKAAEYYDIRIGLMKPFVTTNRVSISTIKIDDYMEHIRYNFLRVYSMSRVLPILKGAQKTLEKYRPIIAVNIGHYKTDFINTLNFLCSCQKNYIYYFRIHSYQGNDCILYGVPKERFNI